MAITITSQPANNSIHASYRPILIGVRLDDAMPIIFCDIYFNGVYYKSLSITASGLLHTFDIQDAAQEYLEKFIAANGFNGIVPVTSLVASCFCRIRGSSINADGFTEVETTVPIQATGTIPASPGSGVQSNTFYPVNSTLQIKDNQNLAAHLGSYKNGTWIEGAYPLTHRRNNYRINGSDYFPILYSGSSELSCLRINYTLKDGTSGNESTCDVFESCPVLEDVTINSVNNGNGTQTISVSWDSPDPYITSIIMQYRPAGGPLWTTDVGTSLSGRSITVPLGLYDFQLTTYGPCDPLTSGIYDNHGIEPPACVVPSIPGSLALPDATIGVPYSHQIPLSGSQPFSLTDLNIPLWLNVTINGSNIVFSGTPSLGNAAVDRPIQFTVHNNCGDLGYDGTMNIVLVPNGKAIQVKVSDIELTLCFPVGYITLYIDSSLATIAPGTIIYNDIALTVRHTGDKYIKVQGESNNYHLNNTNGVVGALTGNSC